LAGFSLNWLLEGVKPVSDSRFPAAGFRQPTTQGPSEWSVPAMRG